MTVGQIANLGYWPSREIPNQGWCGVMQMMFTGALMVGIDAAGYKRRFCYRTAHEAAEAMLKWDGVGDPPGMWIKEKPSDRNGPGHPDVERVEDDTNRGVA